MFFVVINKGFSGSPKRPLLAKWAAPSSIQPRKGGSIDDRPSPSTLFQNLPNPFADLKFELLSLLNSRRNLELVLGCANRGNNLYYFL